MSQLPSFGTYGKYHGDNYGVHCLRFDIGEISVWFSYRTIVAFLTPSTGLVVSENCWGRTTGKHLNWIDGGDKGKRQPRETFETMLRGAIEQPKRGKRNVEKLATAIQDKLARVINS